MGQGWPQRSYNIVTTFQILWTLQSWYRDLEKVYLQFYKADKKKFLLQTTIQTCIRYGPYWLILFIFLLVVRSTLSLWIVLTICLPIIILGEVLQFYLFPRRHFKFVENWMELFIILLSKF